MIPARAAAVQSIPGARPALAVAVGDGSPLLPVTTGYLAALDPALRLPALDPPVLRSPPARGPRTPGLRRWARNEQQGALHPFTVPSLSSHSSATHLHVSEITSGVPLSPHTLPSGPCPDPRSGLDAPLAGAPPAPRGTPFLPEPLGALSLSPPLPPQDRARTEPELPRGLPIPGECAPPAILSPRSGLAPADPAVLPTTEALYPPLPSAFLSACLLGCPSFPLLLTSSPIAPALPSICTKLPSQDDSELGCPPL